MPLLIHLVKELFFAVRHCTKVVRISVHPFVNLVDNISHVLAVNLRAVCTNLVQIAESFQLGLAKVQLGDSFHEKLVIIHI